MPDITMTEKQFEEKIAAVANTAANAAATQVRTEMTADQEKRDLAASKERERIGAFTELKTLYPNQSAMIDEESKKEGANASIQFVKKCADAETARIAAENDQKGNSGDPAPATTSDPESGETPDNSGAMLASALGLKTIGGNK